MKPTELETSRPEQHQTLCLLQAFKDCLVWIFIYKSTCVFVDDNATKLRRYDSSGMDK